MQDDLKKGKSDSDKNKECIKELRRIEMVYFADLLDLRAPMKPEIEEYSADKAISLKPNKVRFITEDELRELSEGADTQELMGEFKETDPNGSSKSLEDYLIDEVQ